MFPDLEWYGDFTYPPSSEYPPSEAPERPSTRPSPPRTCRGRSKTGGTGEATPFPTAIRTTCTPLSMATGAGSATSGRRRSSTPGTRTCASPPDMTLCDVLDTLCRALVHTYKVLTPIHLHPPSLASSQAAGGWRRSQGARRRGRTTRHRSARRRQRRRAGRRARPRRAVMPAPGARGTRGGGRWRRWRLPAPRRRATRGTGGAARRRSPRGGARGRARG